MSVGILRSLRVDVILTLTSLDVTGNVLISGTLKTNDVTESTSISNGSIVAKGGIGVAKTINVGENIRVQKGITLGNNDLTVDTTESDLIMPDLNNTRNIGSSTNKWREIHATTFIGAVEGPVNGSVSGNAGSADKISTPTTFRISGDVETVEQVFDGQEGGNLKNFDVRIKNTIISGKTQVTDSLSNDEFIIDRISGNNTGLRRVSRQTWSRNLRKRTKAQRPKRKDTAAGKFHENGRVRLRRVRGKRRCRKRSRRYTAGRTDGRAAQCCAVRAFRGRV